MPAKDLFHNAVKNALIESIFLEFFEEDLDKLLLQRPVAKLLIFDPNQEVITQWID
ncbi:hypothetical protein OOK60_03675 [Trichothermofontia sichuanensis B231]|uniref:hypothetical protein n=1 Tax=Trichothermofontia sichuanensis TaxID=3045816 RepID=UPI002247C95A|nr:hypothetical protein [Trichothermofontia sichuanensis]UZQ55187.1 hypothetical protein OOK60_03675 [Trichothermofontia sichuanensis B231]